MLKMPKTKQQEQSPQNALKRFSASHYTKKKPKKNFGKSKKNLDTKTTL
jgi:hypothetical protein